MDKQHDIQRLLSIRSLLTTPLASTILQTHPNDIFHNSDWDVVVPSEWRGWWDWAAAADNDEEEKWIELVRYYNRPLDRLNESIPEDLTRLIDSIRSLQLDRTCIYTHSSEPYAELPTGSYVRNNRHARVQLTQGGYGYGMSPKKAHEVAQMSTFVNDLLRSMSDGKQVRHIVDVGAGQGYLTRALVSLNLSLSWCLTPPRLSHSSQLRFSPSPSTQPQRAEDPNEIEIGVGMGMHLLALDSDETQTSGAERWEGKVRKLIRRSRKGKVKEELGVHVFEEGGRGAVGTALTEQVEEDKEEEGGGNGGIMHKTIHITSSTLLSSIDDWISSSSTSSHSCKHHHQQRAASSKTHADPTDDEIPTANSKQLVSVESEGKGGEPIPVLLVALHACGSLTPSILRAFLCAHHHERHRHQEQTPYEQELLIPSGVEEAQGNRRNDEATKGWTPTGLVLVGCCYNLLDPNDFPLSRALSQPKTTATATSNLPSPIPASYLHLAAQIPTTWLIPTNFPGVKLAIRKVVWRALVGGLIAKSRDRSAEATGNENDELSQIPGRRRGSDALPLYGTGETSTHRRLGKINDRAYDDWEGFLRFAGEKMGVDLLQLGLHLSRSSTEEDPETMQRKRKQMENRLQVLHTLRCLLGPLVESMILLDRLVWVREELLGSDGSGMDVELVNLFEQATGSGRNVAIVIKPSVSGPD